MHAHQQVDELTAYRHSAARTAGRIAGQADAATGVAALLVVLGGVFMSVLDFFIVNVAIPSVQRDLHASAAQVQWMVAGFGLGYGCGLVTGGRLGDLYGRRRMYQLGMLAFALASAACGLAPTAGFLVAARVVQGASAALMAPQVLAIIWTDFTGAAQVPGFTLYGLTMGIAAVFGQLIGGLLIRADVFGSGWRSCFLINLPVAVVVLVLLPRLIPESRSPGRPQLDLPGANRRPDRQRTGSGGHRDHLLQHARDGCDGGLCPRIADQRGVPDRDHPGTRTARSVPATCWPARGADRSKSEDQQEAVRP